MDAANDVVTIAESDATVTTIQKSTDTFNVKQSNNNTHTGSNSLLSKIASNVIGNSLNIGGSSNSNSSCSSSSTSSNSSGYGSNTTTPTNNYDLQNTTPTTTPVPTATTSANTEHVIPVATIAAVTPFFSEAITTHNLDTQHHHRHHAQQSQEPLQHQQQQHHMLQTHHQQYSQNHLQANLQHQQHHQYLSRQQYYPPYDYQQSAPTHSLSSAASAAPTVAPYNMIMPGPYEMSSSNVAQAFATSQYKSSGTTIGSTYERNSPLVKTNVAAACTQQQLQEQHVEQQQQQQQPKAINQQFSGLLGSTKPRSSSSFISNSTSSNTSKPQAAATPFYANTIPFYDNYKHKIPLEYADAYSNSSPGTTAATYHQHQKYYAAAKSQLKEASYGSPMGLNSKSVYASTSNVFSGSTGGLNLSSPGSYDKYMYPHAAATAYAATGHLGNETPPEVNNYRKPVMASNMNSPSWPWGIDYASGNSRSIPPPPPASHIPTATVAPTHATHLTQTPSVLARDPFYAPHDKYVGKYDKYSTPSYPQTYVSPPTNRHMWSNTPHASSLTQFNDRHLLASGPPPTLPAHGPHTSPYFSSNHNTNLSSRQTCCSQPYQSQNCYYPVSHSVQPRLAHSQNSGTVAPPTPAGYLSGQQTLGQSPHLSALTASCKYGGVFNDYENANKMKPSNDLYLNSHHYDINPPPPPHSFGYAAAHNSQQLYNTSAHQPMAHGATPTSLLTNDPFNTNPTSYSNDLNLTASNFDNYHTHLDNHPSQQTLTGIHSTQPPPPTYGPTVAKRALLDYRKPIQPQPAPTISADCYTSLTSRDHYNHQELLNTPETTTTFEEYQVHHDNVTDQSTEVLSQSIGGAEEINKNLSLRDFIANWNDDEDEYQNNEEIDFDQNAVINEVLQTAPIEQQQAAAEVVTIQEVKVIKPAHHNIKDAEHLKEAVATTEDPSVLLNETEAGQYVNLPDIVIDVKKSNNVNNSITTPTISPAVSPTQVAVAGNSLNLTDFDVEKELDELNLKKPLQPEQIRDTKSVNTLQLSPGKNINSQLSFEDFNLEPATKTVLNAITTQIIPPQGPELNEQYLKDIEGYESSCSRHSNESAFEKEYETFINKITSESTNKPKPIEAEKEIDFDKNVQDFSKFYKRKRKLKEDGLNASTTASQSKKKIKAVEATKIETSNFPQVYTKKCRNRRLKVKQRRTHKCKPLSAFYKIIYFIRHQRLQREKKVREFILELKDKHLPLIKRQAIKNYTPTISEDMLAPKTLKALCIMMFNREEFRQSLFLTRDQQQDNCLETQEKPTCPDPSCEPCEVIKSLMEETENYEATLLQQTTQPSTVYRTEATKEATTIIDGIPDTNDLNFRNGETIIIEDKFSQLIGGSGLPENLVLEKQSKNLSMEVEQNIRAKDQSDVVLQSAVDNSETSISGANKAETAIQNIVSQAEESREFKTKAIIEETNESRMQPTHSHGGSVIQAVGEIPHCKNLHLKSFPDDTMLYPNLKASDQIDISARETFSEDMSPQVQKLNVSEENTGNKKANLNISSPLKDEKYCKSKDNEESATDDSNSSDSEYESSSSDTEDKLTEVSYKKRSSNNESSDSDTADELQEHKKCDSNSKQTKREERMQPVNMVTQKEENNVCGKKVEENICSPQMQTVATTKSLFDDEKVANSPQRIVIRITKSFTPNEQSLRVENISAKPLKAQTEHENHSESDKEDDAEMKKEKTGVLSTQQENFVSEKPFEKQTDSNHDEDCNTEKKLVTPLKLVLKGKEYLRVKTVRKSLKLRTKRDSNAESESENEEFIKKKSKVLKLSKTREHKDGKDVQESKFKGKEILESHTNTKINPEQHEEPFAKTNQKENIETKENKGETMSNEVSKIYELTSEKELKSEQAALASNSKSESAADDNATPIVSSEKFNEISEERRQDYLLDEASEDKVYPLTTFTSNSPLQSPREDNFNEDESQLVFLPNTEVKEAISFAVMPENTDDLVTKNLEKLQPLEVIETYSLTDSEDETEIYSLSDSASCNVFEYDSDDDNELLQPKTSSTSSNPIIISDDDSLESASENIASKNEYSGKIFMDQEIKIEAKNKEWSQKSTFAASKGCLNNSQYDNIKANLECSKSSLELHPINESKSIDATKTDMSYSEQDIADGSCFSEKDSNEEIISVLNSQKSQKEVVEKEKRSLQPSSINCKANESYEKTFSEMLEEPSPADVLDNPTKPEMGYCEHDISDCSCFSEEFSDEDIISTSNSQKPQEEVEEKWRRSVASSPVSSKANDSYKKRFFGIPEKPLLVGNSENITKTETGYCEEDISDCSCFSEGNSDEEFIFRSNFQNSQEEVQEKEKEKPSSESSSINSKANESFENPFSGISETPLPIDSLENTTKTETSYCEEDISDCSCFSEGNSDEEFIFRSNFQNSQEEVEEKEKHSLESSSVNSKTKGSCEKPFLEIPEIPWPVDSVENATKTETSNSEEDISDCSCFSEEDSDGNVIPRSNFRKPQEEKEENGKASLVSSPVIAKANESFQNAFSEMLKNPLPFENLEHSTKTETTHSEQDISECNCYSEKDSNKEIFLNSKKLQEEEQTDRVSLVSSPVNSKANESYKKEFSGRPIENLEKIFQKHNILEQLKSEVCRQLVIDTNPKKENSEILISSEEKESEKTHSLLEENIDFKLSPQAKNQASELQTKTDENATFNISEGIQILEDNFKAGINEQRLTPNELVTQENCQISTPEPRSPISEEDSDIPQAKEQTSPELATNINISEEADKKVYSSPNNFELLERETFSTKINPSLADNLEDAEQLIIQRDNESCSSGTCSPIPDERSYTPAAVFEEPGKINLSTKTKAAYKSYDLHNVVHEEDLSDSETKKPNSNLENFEVNFNGKAKGCETKEPINVEGDRSPLANVSSENETKDIPEETEAFESTSNQPAIHDEESEKFNTVEEVKNQANGVMNEVKDIQTFEHNIDETITKVASTAFEAAKSQACTSTCSENILIDSIKDSTLITQNRNKIENDNDVELNKNNVDASSTSKDIKEATQTTTSVLSKDSDFADKTEESSETSGLDTHVTQTNAPVYYKYKNLNISGKVEDQCVITEIENKGCHILSECEKSDNLEDSTSLKTETFSPENKSEATEESEITHKIHIQQPVENRDVLKENISNSASVQVSIINAKTTEVERADKSKELSETPALEESSELLLAPNVRQLSENLREEKIAEVTGEKAEVISMIPKIVKDSQASDEEGSLIQSTTEESDEVNFKQMEDNISTEILTPSFKSKQNSKAEQMLAEANIDDNNEKTIQQKATEVTVEKVKVISMTPKTANDTKAADVECSLIQSGFEKSDEVNLKQIEEIEGNISVVRSTPGCKLNQTSKVKEMLKDAKTDDNTEVAIEEKETVSESATETEERNFQESSIASTEKGLTFDDADLTKEISMEEGNDEASPKGNKSEEINSQGSSTLTDFSGFISQLSHSKVDINKEKGNEVLEQEEKDNPIFMHSPLELERSNPTDSSNLKSELSQVLKENNKEENKLEEYNFKESSNPTDHLSSICQLQHSEREVNKEESNEAPEVEREDKLTLTETLIRCEGKSVESSSSTPELNPVSKEIKEEENKSQENNIKESSIATNDHSKTDVNKEETNEVLKEEGKDKSTSTDSSAKFEACDLGENSNPIDSSSLTSELHTLSKGINRKESNKDLDVEEEDLSVTPDKAKLSKQKDFEESCILSNEKLSLSEAQNISKDVAKEIGSGEKIVEGEGTRAFTKSEIDAKDHDLEENLIFNSEMKPILNEIKEIESGTENKEPKISRVVSKINLKASQEKDLNVFFLQEAQNEHLEVVLQQEESLDNSTRQDCDVSNEVMNEELSVDHQNNFNNDQITSTQAKDAEVAENIENSEGSGEILKNDHQTLTQNDSQVLVATQESTLVQDKENSNVKDVSKPYITPDELSADFYGFKNQSSFEDESEDFHGFEDLEEVARIRQEIENLNDDAAANDGFLNNATLNQAMHKTSLASLTDSMTSEINEMEALEKELSQHKLEMEAADYDRETEKEYQIKRIRTVSTNDIEHIKQMLESDEEQQNEGENQPGLTAHTSKDKSVANKYIDISNEHLISVSSIIPKLSDLCRAALNSSLNLSSNLVQQQIETPTVLVERELSVEEALAEMYRQAGVLLSDSEDCDNDVPSLDDTEGHDVLLINLQEILNSDNNDVYVLRCDMNENVQSNEEHDKVSLEIDGGVNTERVNTVQIILDTQNAEPQIHIISSDSESEIIILSDDDSELGYRQFKARQDNVTIPFINDEEIDNDDDNLFDISTIHHEEIVPDNLAKFLRDEFYKYLHEKYVQRSISKYYHAHRVLKKYKRRFFRRQ